LVGNARQLLLAGARTGVADAAQPTSGYIKANVEPQPPAQEALSHILVRLQPGAPSANPTDPPNSNSNAISGSGSFSGLFTGPDGGPTATFSVNTDAGILASDYSVVAGPDRQGGTQAPGVHVRLVRLQGLTDQLLKIGIGEYPCREQAGSRKNIHIRGAHIEALRAGWIAKDHAIVK
jgi:hypothetical protein